MLQQCTAQLRKKKSTKRALRTLRFFSVRVLQGHVCVCVCVCACVCVCVCALPRVFVCVCFSPGKLKSRTNQKLPDSARPYPMWTLRMRGQLVEERGGEMWGWGGVTTEMESRKNKRMLRLPCITHDSRTRLCQKSLAYDTEHALNTFIPFLCARKCASETEVDIKEEKKKGQEGTYSPLMCAGDKTLQRTAERHRANTQSKVEPRAANQNSELFEYSSSSGNTTCRYILRLAYYSVQ